jgi:hypothetical protein
MWPLTVRQWARADSISLSAIATPEAREPGPLVTRDGLRSCSGRAPASRHPAERYPQVPIIALIRSAQPPT